MKKRILVTGGAGFIGSHTVDLLLQNENRVIVYDNLSTGKLTHLDLFNPDLEFIPGDVLDYPALLTQVKRADVILHLAALPSVPKSIEDPIHSLRVNTQGFLHILQAIREAEKKSRLVFASSAAVYGGDTTLPCSEETAAQNLLSPYALEKSNNEKYADLYSRLFGIKTLALRYFNVYGPRQDPSSPYSGVISKFIDTYKKREPITIWGDGEQCRDFIYVSDIARANVLALESEYTGVLNIATGQPETLHNLINYIEQQGSHAADKLYVAARVGDIKESYANPNKAKQFLNFEFKTALADGIEQLMKN